MPAVVMVGRIRWGWAFVGLLSVGGGSNAWAQGNPNSQVLGGASALKGGTGVALGDDAAAPFLNPATIARIDQSSLALSSQLVEFTYQRLVDFQQPSPGPGGVQVDDTDITNISVNFVPAALCYFQNFGGQSPAGPTASHTLSFCFGSTERNRISTLGDADSGSNDRFRVDLASSGEGSWSRNDFVLTWAHFFVDWLAAGASIAFEYASQRLIYQSFATLNDLGTGTGLTNSIALGRSANSYTLRAEVGALFHLNDDLKLGISFRSPSWVFASDFNGTQAITDVQGTTAQQALTGSFFAPAPIRIGLGLAYESRQFDLETDFFLYPPQDDFLKIEGELEEVVIAPDGTLSRSTSDYEERESSQFVANVALGVRYRLNSTWSLLAGAQTDFSLLRSRKELEPDERIATQSRDIYHGSVGTGYRGPFGRIVTGFRVSYSNGQILAPDNFASSPSFSVVDDELLTVFLVVYGSLDVTALAEKVTPKFLEKDKDGSSADVELEQD